MPEPDRQSAVVPSDPERVQRYVTKMTPIRFKTLFNLQERATLQGYREYDGADADARQIKAALDILLGDLDDPRLTEVDVAELFVVQGLDFLEAKGVLAPLRVSTIKRGAPV